MNKYAYNENWLMKIRYDESAKFNLICFPWGGGNASSFVVWKSLPKDLVNIWAVKMPGRETKIDNEFIYYSSELINFIIDSLPISKTIPFIFYGHSLGAGLAFQTILELKLRNLSLPALYFATGRMPPHYSNNNPIANMNNIEIINYITKFGGVGVEISEEEEFLRYYLEKIKADYILNSSIPAFKPSPLPIYINIINGKDDPLIQIDKLNEWSLHTCFPLESVLLPGGHFFMKEVFKEFINIIELRINQTLIAKC